MIQLDVKILKLSYLMMYTPALDDINAAGIGYPLCAARFIIQSISDGITCSSGPK